MRRALPVTVILFGGAIASCSVISGLDEFELASPEATAGAGAGGTGGTGGSAGGPPVEHCTNGADDEGDGLVDCEDPDCADHRCLGPAPDGWSGPFWLYDGDPAAAPDCAEVFLDDAGTALVPEDAQCSACACPDPVEGAACAKGSVTLYSNASCTGLLGSAALSSCGGSLSGGVVSARVPATVVAGTCGPPSPQQPAVPPRRWGRLAQLCDPGSSAAGCEAGTSCTPPPPPPFEAALCVARFGNHACPAGPYPGRRLVFSDVADSRTCTDCTCSPQADACPGTVYGYTNTTCTGSPVLTTDTAVAQCFNTQAHHFQYIPGAPVNPTCAPGGGQPTGCIAPTDPVTLCCESGGSACPAGTVEVPAPSGETYCMDATEVTREQYQAFLEASPAPADQPPYCSWNSNFAPSNAWPPAPDELALPVVNVDWCDAAAYCAWAGKRLCGGIGGGPVDTAGIDDPAQSQWYNACSAGGTRAYPYGQDALPGICRVEGSGSNGNDPAPAGSLPCCMGGVDGLLDLAGNVAEWEDACDQYQGSGDTCLVRGGSFDSSPQQARCVADDYDPRNRRDPRIGFRCCSP